MEKVDRIEIRDDGGNPIERCYNIEKLGKYGICRTNEENPPYTWGFCSKSCDVFRNPDQYQSYEEAKFLYFDTLPPHLQNSKYSPIARSDIMLITVI